MYLIDTQVLPFFFFFFLTSLFPFGVHGRYGLWFLVLDTSDGYYGVGFMYIQVCHCWEFST